MSSVIVLIVRIILALSLYSFLGWVVYTIWSELKLNNTIVSANKIPPISLSMIDSGEERNQIFTIAEVMVGRDVECDFCIPNETVSAHHARLSYHHKQWWVEDLHSTNGTYLNDERVSLATVIISGDELRCGKTNVSVSLQPG